MVLAAGICYLLFCHVEQGGFGHTPGVPDTVRYTRDEFGVRLHVPNAWKGQPILLFASPKDAIRTVPLDAADASTFRGRFRATGELRYAFWIDPVKYRPGAAGLIYDQAGLHTTATPTWFEQAPGRYPESKPPHWPSEGAVFYALDTDRFGDGSFAEKGAQSFTKHLDYVQGLGVNGVWLNAIHADSGDTIEDAHRTDWHVIAEAQKAPKDADGVAGTAPPDANGWRIGLADESAYPLIQAGGANGVLDRRWDRLVYGFVRDPKVLPSNLVAGLRNLRSDYPDSVASQMVLRLAGPGRPRPSAVFRADRKRLLQLLFLLFTLPGVPVVDAGDEIGLLDADAPMEWSPDRQDAGLLDVVKKLVQARTSRPSLYRGEYHPLDLEDDNHVFAFARIDRMETTIVLLNNSDDIQRVTVPVGQFGSADLRDLYGNTSFSVNGTTISISLPAHGLAMLGS